MEQISINAMGTRTTCVLSNDNSYDEIALNMLKYNKIAGLISPIQCDMQTMEVNYSTTGKIPLEEIVEESNEWSRIKNILIQICRQAFPQFIEYMLFPNQIYYNPQYIFIENESIEYIYIPERASNEYNLKKMLQYILENNRWNERENKPYFDEVLNYLNSIQWLGDVEKEQCIALLERIDVELLADPIPVEQKVEPMPQVQPVPPVEPVPQVQPVPLVEPMPPIQPIPPVQSLPPMPSMMVSNMQMPSDYGVGETTILSEVGETTVLSNVMPQQNQAFLIRQRTQERINVVSEYFRIGKNIVDVDYTIAGNPAISRSHAAIIVSNGKYYIKDTNSKNHTWVNGIMLSPNQEMEITHQASVKMADEEFVFYEHE